MSPHTSLHDTRHATESEGQDKLRHKPSAPTVASSAPAVGGCGNGSGERRGGGAGAPVKAPRRAGTYTYMCGKGRAAMENEASLAT